MPRRIFTYDNSLNAGFQIGSLFVGYNLLITIGGFTFGISQLIMFGNLLWSARRGPPATQDPWNAYSLEWGVPSPPPEFNFPEGVPVISATGVTYRPVSAANVGPAMANGGHAMANGGHAYGGHGARPGEENWRPWAIVTPAGVADPRVGHPGGVPPLPLGDPGLAHFLPGA